MTTVDNGQHFATRSKVAKKPLSFFREAGRGKALVQINNVVKFHPGIVALMGDEGSGRSRVLKQFAESLKNKPGAFCILDRSLKNEEQLYAAMADEFAIDRMPGENLTAIQKAVYAFLAEQAANKQPAVIALDNTQRCSLAVLEALLALRAKYKTLSLILVGDLGLQKMLQRLQGGNQALTAVQLAPFNPREIQQYLNWRLPFHVSEEELALIANTTGGNIASLEQEALKAENNYRQKSTGSSGAAWGALSFSRSAAVNLLIAVLMVGGLAAVFYYLPRESVPALKETVGKIEPLLSEWLSAVPGINKTTVAAPPSAPEATVTTRSNQEWTERQIAFLMAKNNQAM